MDAPTEPVAVAAVPTPLSVMLAQVGVKEATGNNDGHEVEKYLASVGLGKGHPWCAAAVHWCYRECGVVLEPKREFAMALRFHTKPMRVWEKSGWEPDIGDWQRISEDGDHFSLWYSNLGRIGHTGLIYGEDEKFLLTVEANTGSGGEREGDGCYLRRRLKRTIHCVSRWPITTTDGIAARR